MCLYDLVDDGEAQASASFKLRLERLKDLFGLLWCHARPGIRKVDLPVVAGCLYRHGQRASLRHGAHGVLTKIPEHLFDLVAIGQNVGFIGGELSVYANSPLFLPEAVSRSSACVVDPSESMN